MYKTVMITGASKGIGSDLSSCFLDEGSKVLGTSRNGKNPGPGENNLEFLRLDLSKPTQITELEELLEERNIEIDVLVNNAGVGPDLDAQYPDLDTFERTFDVNVTGTVFLTETILPFMAQGGKLVNISSRMGSISECDQTDSVAYRMSKASLNMYTQILAKRLKGKLSIAAVHPGWVRTNISDNSAQNGRLSSKESARNIFNFILSEYETGTFWDAEFHKAIEW